MVVKQPKIMIHWYQFSLNSNSNEIHFTVNYRFPKSTKAYDQGQKIFFFTLNQYFNDHGYINLSQMI